MRFMSGAMQRGSIAVPWPGAPHASAHHFARSSCDTRPDRSMAVSAGKPSGSRWRSPACFFPRHPRCLDAMLIVRTQRPARRSRASTRKATDTGRGSVPQTLLPVSGGTAHTSPHSCLPPLVTSASSARDGTVMQEPPATLTELQRCCRSPRGSYGAAWRLEMGNVPEARHKTARLDNPCVGGSIPPRATKNIPKEPLNYSVFGGRNRNGCWPRHFFSYVVVFSPLLGLQCGVFVAILRLSSHCRRNLGVHAPPIPAGEHQIRQPEQREQLRVVLGQTAVAGLAMSEQALHDMEAMLNLGTHAGLRLFQFLDRAAQRIFLEDLALTNAHSGMPVNTLGRVLFGFATP
jgi:hypothetical protein